LKTETCNDIRAFSGQFNYPKSILAEGGKIINVEPGKPLTFSGFHLFFVIFFLLQPRV
jgi:hypothetical protein